MKSFRRRRGIDLEHELRANRPEPRPEFLAMLGERVDGNRGRTHARVRIAFGAALTAGLLAAVAAVGGVGYGASAAQKVAKTVVRITHVNHPRVVVNSAAADQYPTNVKICYKGRVRTIPSSQLAKFKANGAKVVSRSERNGSKCSFRAGKKGRQHGAPAFTG